MKPYRVSYLGPAGTYSEEAARAHFGAQVELVPATAMGEALQWAEQGKTHATLLPIENSTEGVVNYTLDLLQSTPLTISGEVLLPISHRLLSHAGDPRQVVIVLGHPQALAQCRLWLDRNLPHADRQAAASNGEAAKLAAQNPMLAAIAGLGAAQIYAVPVLAENIADDPSNTTRFVALSSRAPAPTGHDSTSLVCTAADNPGGLLAVLTILARHNINISKLQSRPMPGKLWKYVFYVDVDGHFQDPEVAQALQELHTQKMLIKVLGSYPRAPKQSRL